MSASTLCTFIVCKSPGHLQPELGLGLGIPYWGHLYLRALAGQILQQTSISAWINSLAPGRSDNNFGSKIFNLIPQNSSLGACCEISLRRLALNLGNVKSTLIQVMAWCRQATSHCLNQCWPRSLTSYGVTRPQWVNSLSSTTISKTTKQITSIHSYSCFLSSWLTIAKSLPDLSYSFFFYFFVTIFMPSIFPLHSFGCKLFLCKHLSNSYIDDLSKITFIQHRFNSWISSTFQNILVEICLHMYICALHLLKNKLISYLILSIEA